MRRSPRTSVSIPSTLGVGGIEREGTIINLGFNGALIELPDTSGLSPVTSLKFSLPNRTQPIETLGRVVRADLDALGMEFLDLDPQDLEFLWTVLAPKMAKGLKDCCYCAHPLPVKKPKACPACHRPLDLLAADYLEKLEEGDEAPPQEMIGTSPAMLQVFQMIRKVAVTDVPVLLTGASGTGKEMVARAIHERSQRGQGPFIAINCGAIPRELLESELFGHEKGAFTGAHRTVIGTLERADKGTLFLDEVGELPLELQVKLLRFLQEYSFERVGGRRKITVDMRVISATNSDLPKLVASGHFRDDLYYRLDVVNIHLPPLKERGEDALIMANVFLRRYGCKVGKEIKGFTKEATAALQTHPWPGNIRELINRIRRGVVMAEGPWIKPENLDLAATDSLTPPLRNGLGLKEARARYEAQLVSQAIVSNGGSVQMAAKTLKISRSAIYQLIQKYSLKHLIRDS